MARVDFQRLMEWPSGEEQPDLLARADMDRSNGRAPKPGKSKGIGFGPVSEQQTSRPVVWLLQSHKGDLGCFYQMSATVFGFYDAVDRRDVWTIERRQHLRLALAASHSPRIAGKSVTQNFHGGRKIAMDRRDLRQLGVH